MGHCLPSVWNGSWNDALDNPSAASAVSAMSCAIGTASAHAARGRTSCKRQASGSNPLTGSQFSVGKHLISTLVRGTWRAVRPADPRHRPRPGPWYTSPSITSSAPVIASARTPRLTRTAGSRSTRPPACSSRATWTRSGTSLPRLASSCEMMRTCSPMNRACPAVEPGLGHAQGRCSRRCRRGGARHQGRTALHRQPAPRRRLRPAQHRRAPRPQRRRSDHAPALRRPSPPRSTGAPQRTWPSSPHAVLQCRLMLQRRLNSNRLCGPDAAGRGG